MGEIRGLHRRRRVRPTPNEWNGSMRALADEHTAHLCLPFHVLQAAGDRLGVAARSLEPRYREFVQQLAAASGWSLDATASAVIASAADFADAYGRLEVIGLAPAFPILDRAIWMDISRGLVGLRVAERRRRQAMAESGTCQLCSSRDQLAEAA